ncbi:hypothetical protein A3D00_04855 [Candidatus Woesebacteria bacterium RIFCSPHIGHO2_02_FULL_38_9]|uniref:Peptidase C69 n=1 Tax=Candidatus Woesebacteria bacterium RIFCSPHIGHO2_01_FULL_39_28 TaxID=1802496 RepID=A0A1F7YB31_9BACT|nr:MAG: hypothetical protein A2627_02055 [Candidatus Woesebacteria bacterium RIFCSPHIGHO2_01_FULL_39_28]OGM32323.1 MAG: hypothetical protein A3D00_04855 [Candidatus Woesebacteria bacterium RIFCSPHIGHO2_02_FULL_38_9]
MVTENKLKKIAKEVLRISKVAESEVLLLVGEHGLTRFANNQIHQNVAWEDVGISVRIINNKKIGVASGNSFKQTDLNNVVERASQLSKLQKEDPNYICLPEAKKIDRIKESVYDSKPEERAEAVDIIIRKAKDNNIIASGAFDSSTTEIAVANSRGVWAYHAASSSDLSTIILGADSTGFASKLGRKPEQINAEEVANKAIQKVLEGKNPQEVKPSEWDVILEPQAVNEMMTFFSWLGPNPRIYFEQASNLSGKVGKKIFGSNITIIDDPLNKSTFQMPFDFEGYPKKRLEIVKNGILKSLVYDSYYANKYKKENSGHALPAPNTNGPMPFHLVIAPGKKSLDEMIKNVKKGLLVTRLWYVRVLNPRSLNITGMTRDGTFIIRNGEIIGAAKNLRFNQSIPEALNNVVEIGRDLELLSSFESEIGTNRMPSLHIKNWNFTSGTEF